MPASNSKKSPKTTKAVNQKSVKFLVEGKKNDMSVDFHRYIQQNESYPFPVEFYYKENKRSFVYNIKPIKQLGIQSIHGTPLEQMKRLVRRMSEHNSKKNIKEIKYELTKLRHTSDLATRQGQSKIDRNAELEALRFRE